MKQTPTEPAPAAWADALARRFPELVPSALQALAAQARCRGLRRGEALLREGEAWQQAFWVQAGALRLYYVDAQGAESNKNFHLEDAFIWPLTRWLRAEPVAFHVEALEPGAVWCLPVAALEAAVAALPSWTALRLQALGGLLEDKMRREQAFLQCSARQRYEALLREQPLWARRIALRHLASYLGMTDVSLSRLRAEMGLIEG